MDELDLKRCPTWPHTGHDENMHSSQHPASGVHSADEMPSTSFRMSSCVRLQRDVS